MPASSESAHGKGPAQPILAWLAATVCTGVVLGVLLGMMTGKLTAGIAIGAGCGLTAGIGMTAILGQNETADEAAVRLAERQRATILAVIGLLVAAATSIVTSTYIYLH